MFFLVKLQTITYIFLFGYIQTSGYKSATIFYRSFMRRIKVGNRDLIAVLCPCEMDNPLMDGG